MEKRAGFPIGDLSGARLAGGDVADAGEAEGVLELIFVEVPEAGGGDGAGEGAVDDVVPSAGAKAGGVAEAALDFVGDHGCEDQVFFRTCRRPGRRRRRRRCCRRGERVRG